MPGLSGFNLDDVACITVLTVVAASIGVAAAAFVAEDVRRGDPSVQQCQRTHSTAPVLPSNG